MKCPKCGSENKEGSRFCKECGSNLQVASSSEAPMESKTNKNIFLIVGAVILCIIVLGGAMAILGDNSDKNEVVNSVGSYDEDDSSTEVTDTSSSENVDEDRYSEFDKSEWYLPSYRLEDIYTAHTPDDVKAEMFDKADANGDGVLIGDEIKEMDYLLKHSAYTWQGPGMAIHNVTINSGKYDTDKTVCSVYVGAGEAGETVKLSVLYTSNGKNLNQARTVPVKVEKNGYVTLSTEEGFDYYPDHAYISLYDKDGELIDKKTVKLEPKSGSQSF